MIISGWLLGIIGTCCWINFLKSFWSYLYVGIPTTPHMLCELNWMHYIWRMFLHFCHCYQKNILASHLLSLDCLLDGIMAYDYLGTYLVIWAISKKSYYVSITFLFGSHTQDYILSSLLYKGMIIAISYYLYLVVSLGKHLYWGETIMIWPHYGLGLH